MITENAKIIKNTNIRDKYFQIDFYAPQIAGQVLGGQFIHLKINGLKDRLFRRPFSVYNVNHAGILSVIYKVVGVGTDLLSRLKEGDVCNLLGPSGSHFTMPAEGERVLIIAGGYGSAATYLSAKKIMGKGIILLGAKTKSELILTEEYEKLGFEVKIATEDGSAGKKGLVTSLLASYIKEGNLRIYACGPNPMMYAIAGMLKGSSIKAELSLDHPMCCGVGACFACVVKVKAENEQGWKYERSCREGPVFDIKKIYT